MSAPVAWRRELANTIAYQAEAVAKGTVTNEPAAVQRILSNAETLAAWTIVDPEDVA